MKVVIESDVIRTSSTDVLISALEAYPSDETVIVTSGLRTAKAQFQAMSGYMRGWGASLTASLRRGGYSRRVADALGAALPKDGWTAEQAIAAIASIGVSDHQSGDAIDISTKRATSKAIRHAVAALSGIGAYCLVHGPSGVVEGEARFTLSGVDKFHLHASVKKGTRSRSSAPVPVTTTAAITKDTSAASAPPAPLTRRETRIASRQQTSTKWSR